MRAGDILDRAHKVAAPAMGQIALALEVKKPVPKAALSEWSDRLRAAANELDKLLKD